MVSQLYQAMATPPLLVRRDAYTGTSYQPSRTTKICFNCSRVMDSIVGRCCREIANVDDIIKIYNRILNEYKNGERNADTDISIDDVIITEPCPGYMIPQFALREDPCDGCDQKYSYVGDTCLYRRDHPDTPLFFEMIKLGVEIGTNRYLGDFMYNLGCLGIRSKNTGRICLAPCLAIPDAEPAR